MEQHGATGTRSLRIEGKTVVLDEIRPAYFTDVIRWRNNPARNRYINQHFVLTDEQERRWYEETYLKDPSQGLFVFLDRATGTPFGTSGWTDYDAGEKRCIWGRLMAGEDAYQGSVPRIAGIVLAVGYFFDTLGVEKAYSQIVEKNAASIRLNHRFGFFEQPDGPVFADHFDKEADPMVELVATRDTFAKARRNIEAFLEEFA